MTVRVLYVVGFGRSGSTLLGNVLGSIDGWFSTGELHLLWVALQQGSGCGCGERVADCPVWSSVLERLAQRPDALPDPAEVREWQLAEARLVHTRRLIRMGDRPESGRPVLDRYAGLLGDLYRAIAQTTGANVIVDSSKTPSDAAILPRLDGIEWAILHVVRDPRAVAFSQGRVQPTLDQHRGGQMHRRGVVESASRWVTVNRAAEQLRDRAPDRYAMLRYEDFVQSPRSALEPLVGLAGDPTARLPFVDDRTVRMGTNHTVWGNRNRFSSGDVAIRADEAWRSQAPGGLVASTTAMTWPWLGRYGYPFRLHGAGRTGS